MTFCTLSFGFFFILLTFGWLYFVRSSHLCWSIWWFCCKKIAQITYCGKLCPKMNDWTSNIYNKNTREIRYFSLSPWNRKNTHTYTRSLILFFFFGFSCIRYEFSILPDRQGLDILFLRFFFTSFTWCNTNTTSGITMSSESRMFDWTEIQSLCRLKMVLCCLFYWL